MYYFPSADRLVTVSIAVGSMLQLALRITAQFDPIYLLNVVQKAVKITPDPQISSKMFDTIIKNGRIVSLALRSLFQPHKLEEHTKLTSKGNRG